MREAHVQPSELGFDLRNSDQYFQFLRIMMYVKHQEVEQRNADQTSKDARNTQYISEANQLLDELGAPPPEPERPVKVIHHVSQ